MKDPRTLTAMAIIVVEGIAVILLAFKMPPEGLWWHAHPEMDNPWHPKENDK